MKKKVFFYCVRLGLNVVFFSFLSVSDVLVSHVMGFDFAFSILLYVLWMVIVL